MQINEENSKENDSNPSRLSVFKYVVVFGVVTFILVAGLPVLVLEFDLPM